MNAPKIQDVMTRTVHSVGPDASLREAARMMEKHDIGVLPVLEDGEKGGRPLGMVTDRDICIRAVAQGADASNTRVKDVMTPHAESLPEDADVARAARLMVEKQIRRLLVTDRSGRICGILSLGDLAVRMDDNELPAEILEKVCEPIHVAS